MPLLKENKMTGTQIAITIISAILGSTGLTTLVQFLITRKDKKKDLLIKIDHKIDVLEKDGCRTQLLLLLSDYPENIQEIMTLAEHYFCRLHGDWYLSSMFNDWLEKRHLSKPLWFTYTK